MDGRGVISRLADSDSLLDVMIQIEDFLDTLDLYAFENWFDGVLIDGPTVKRYWVNVTLKYPKKKMPNPQGGLRLAKYGAKCYFEKGTEEVPVEVKSPDDLDPKTRAPKMKKEPIWLIHLKIPRRFVDELDIDDLELNDEDLDIEAAEAAADAGIDENTDIKKDQTDINAEPTDDTNGGEELAF